MSALLMKLSLLPDNGDRGGVKPLALRDLVAQGSGTKTQGVFGILHDKSFHRVTPDAKGVDPQTLDTEESVKGFRESIDIQRAAQALWIKMTHVERFHGIPMSKSMRGLCKEEDYTFLGKSLDLTQHKTDRDGAVEDDWITKKEERVRRRLEREQQEKERLKAIEDLKKEKDQQWRAHIAVLTSNSEKTLQDRRKRLKRFREFQRKVLVDESGMEGTSAYLTVTQLLTRM